MGPGIVLPMYNVASEFSGSNVSVDQFFANLEDTVINSEVRQESEHFATSCLVSTRMRLNHGIPRVADSFIHLPKDQKSYGKLEYFPFNIFEADGKSQFTTGGVIRGQAFFIFRE